MIKLHNDKGEVFDFPVGFAQITRGRFRNRFGNLELISYPLVMRFKDSDGRERILRYWLRIPSDDPNDPTACQYYGMNDAGRVAWGYKCIFP
jgi:hypothetical protein